jgi:hypothetical protein
MTDAAITEGREAWQRLKSRERKDWQDWLAVGRAIEIGKATALKAAATNRPVGSKYNRAMGQWLRDNGLADVNAQERYRLLLILEKLAGHRNLARWSRRCEAPPLQSSQQHLVRVAESRAVARHALARR